MFHDRQGPAKTNLGGSIAPVEWENVIQSPLQSSHLAGLIAIHAAYEKKPFIYFSQLLPSQLKGIPSCFWVLIQQIISAHFRKRCDHEIFWLHSKCAPTLFVVCLTFAWEMARQKFPEIADLGITSQDHFFEGNSRPSKETKWAATLFNRTTQLSFIGSLNKSQAFIYFLFPKWECQEK